MQNVLRALALVLAFGLLSTQAYGQACAGQTAPAQEGVTPAVLTQITDMSPNGSEEATFRYPSNDVVNLDLADFGVPVSAVIGFDAFNESLQFDGEPETILVTEGAGGPVPTPTQNATVTVDSDNSPGNSTWQIPASDDSDYIGCVTLGYSATQDGVYDVNLRPLLGGFLVITSLPALPGGVNLPLPIEVGDTILYDSLPATLASINIDPVPLVLPNGFSFTQGQIDTIVNQIVRPTPGSMQTRFGKNETVGVVELAQAINFQVYPNPVNTTSVVRYRLESSTDMSITLTDVAGRAITEVFSGNQSAGTYEHALCADCADLTPGLYFVHVFSNQQQFSQRIVVR